MTTRHNIAIDMHTRIIILKIKSDLLLNIITFIWHHRHMSDTIHSNL